MTERGSAEAMLEAYGEAVYEKDVRVFDLWGTWSYDGTGAWRQMVTDWFGSLGSERVEVESE